MFATVTSRRSRISPIGVDVGQRGIRMAQLTYARGVYTVRATSRADSRAPSHESTDVRDRLRACFQQGEFRGRSAVFALSSPEVGYFALELPPVSPAEQAQIAHFEVQRLVAERTPDVEIRHWALPAGRPQAPSALGLAAPRAAVEQVVQLTRHTPFTCARVDTAETALCRLGGLLIPENANGVWGLLDYGHTHARLILCVEDVPVLIRVVGPGSGALTTRLAESLQISETTAEVHKSEHGIAEPEKTPADGGGREIGAMHFSILRTDLQAIAAEIKRSYEYVLSCYPGRKALDLVLTGGGARLKNLDVFLSGALGITVRGASTYVSAPRCRLRFVSGQSVPLELMAQAMGLAIMDL